MFELGAGKPGADAGAPVDSTTVGNRVENLASVFVAVAAAAALSLAREELRTSKESSYLFVQGAEIDLEFLKVQEWE